MADRTAINYVDASWNPVGGCTPVSAGCANCFAARYARRRLGAFTNGRPFGAVQLREDQLDVPLRWRQPRTILVPTLGDLFHPDVPAGFIDRVFAVMALSPHHRYLLLTKRPQRMRAHCLRFASEYELSGPAGECIRGLAPLWNLCLGVSVEDQASADERIPILLDTPAAHRWVSFEPAIGPVDLQFLWEFIGDIRIPNQLPSGRIWPDWVVIGGETGPGARPCRVEWIRAVVEQCRAARVPVWVKQLGSFACELARDEPTGRFRTDPETGRRQFEIATPRLVSDRNGAQVVEWPADLRVRQHPWDRQGADRD